MDFEILPQLVIILSMAGILAIVGKNFSKMKEAGSEELFLEESDKEKKEKEKFLYLYKRATRRINKENYQKKMAEFWVWFEKLLRKLRIIFLRVDGRIVAVLEQLRKKNVESLEDLRRRTEKNMNREKANEAFAKFWNNSGWGGRPKTGREAAQLTVDMLAPKVADRDENTGAEDALPTTGDAEAYTLTPEEAEEIKKAQTSYVEAVYSEPEEILAVAEAATPEIGIEPEIEDELAPAAAQKEAVFAEEAPAQEISVEESMSEVVEEEPVFAEETGTVLSETEDAKAEETEEEKKIRTRKEQEYIEILMKDPADIKAYWKLGLIYSKRRNYEDALACFRQIVKIDPTYTKAKQKAIELMEKMKGKVK